MLPVTVRADDLHLIRFPLYIGETGLQRASLAPVRPVAQYGASADPVRRLEYLFVSHP